MLQIHETQVLCVKKTPPFDGFLVIHEGLVSFSYVLSHEILLLSFLGLWIRIINFGLLSLVLGYLRAGIGDRILIF